MKMAEVKTSVAHDSLIVSAVCTNPVCHAAREHRGDDEGILLAWAYMHHNGNAEHGVSVAVYERRKVIDIEAVPAGWVGESDRPPF